MKFSKYADISNVFTSAKMINKLFLKFTQLSFGVPKIKKSAISFLPKSVTQTCDQGPDIYIFKDNVRVLFNFEVKNNNNNNF